MMSSMGTSSTVKSSTSSAAIKSRLAATILDHHRKWRVFRSSLRALYATDPVVREARLAQRERQIAAMPRQSREFRQENYGGTA